MNLSYASSLLASMASCTLFNNHKQISPREFQAIFGVSLPVGGRVFLKLTDANGFYCTKKLLMGLFFLKGYATLTVNSMTFGVDGKTFQKHSWVVVNDLANLSVIDFSSRISDKNKDHIVRMSVDGTDCKIQEQRPFDPMWFSHKFKGPGLRYEVVVGLREEGILWVNGPFPCGSWPDLKIARDGLVNFLEAGEKVIADGGYRGDDHFLTPTGINDDYSRVMAVVRARHETVNGRLKSFNVLDSKFRHSIAKHGICFMAVVNLVQIGIHTDAPLFTII